MSEPAAFRATYSDLRFVKSRKVAQVIVELPIEDAGRFVEAFGAPNPATETWVAIARLQEPVRAQEPAKEKRRFSELPPSQQAAMRCQEPGFWKFLSSAPYNYECSTTEHAAEAVREICDVKSRGDLNDYLPAAHRWKLLDNEYFGWSRGYA